MAVGLAGPAGQPGGRALGGIELTRHACPGYKLSVGVLLGFFTAVPTAGELRPTADPRVFTQIRS